MIDESVLADGLDVTDLPPELRQSVTRHQAHLGALVASLRAAGVDEAMVEESVRQLIDSYRVELTAALRTMSRGGVQ